MRKVGRIAIGLLAGVLVLSALASITRIPARFVHQPRVEGGTTGSDVRAFLGATPSSDIAAPVVPAVPAVPQRPCDRPTLIGRIIPRSLTVRSLPSVSSAAIASFHRTNAEGATQVFDIQGSVRNAAGDRWYRALLPLRPNGTSGYMAAGSVRLVQTSYRIEVDRKRLRLTVWDGCAVRMRLPIGLGKESTPTPNGRYYIIALLKPPLAGSVYGTYAYGLSAFSDVLTDWKGGGIIGLHGTNDPSSIGNRKSHGCIRLRNRDIEKLVPILPLGTPVDIG
jgi:lipoprotein-anchoring transpeptidase ErfK/SrfK